MADGMIKPTRHPESILLSGDTYQSIFRPFSSSPIRQDPISNTIRQDLISKSNRIVTPRQTRSGGKQHEKRKEKKGLYTYENDKKLVPYRTIKVRNHPSSFSFRSSGVAQPELHLIAVGPSTYESVHRSQATRGSVLTRPTL